MANNKKLMLTKQTIKTLKFKSKIKTGAGIDNSIDGGSIVYTDGCDVGTPLTTKCPGGEDGGTTSKLQ